MDRIKDLSVVLLSDLVRKDRCKCKQYLVELACIQSRKKLTVVKKEALIQKGYTKTNLK